MDIDKIIEELRRERESLSDAIAALERLLPEGARPGLSTGRRPGRPAGSKNKPRAMEAKGSA